MPSANQGSAESGAHFDDSNDFDPELGRLVEAWPDLPEATRRDILTMVESALPHGGDATRVNPTPATAKATEGAR